MSPSVRELVEGGFLHPADAAFAEALGRLSGERDPLALLGAAVARAHAGRGHVCVDVGALGGRPITGWEEESGELGTWPDAGAWRRSLSASPLVAGRDGIAPLVLEGDRLYLHRLAEIEARVAGRLLERMAGGALLGVVTGGPGTGKTSALAGSLAGLAGEIARAGGRPPRIALAAPTGKAAARISAAIGAAKRGEREPSLRCPPEVAAAIPDQASTVHRLLGYRPGRERRFLFDARHRLPFDVVAVDEASMVDLELMAALLDAAPPSARVLLLGDRNQLASVQAGAVLADICSCGAGAAWFTELERSYRFAPGSALGESARMVNSGRARELLRALEEGRFGDGVTLVRPAGARKALDAIASRAADAFRGVLSEGDPGRRLAALSRFGVLCAHRHGPLGSIEVNLEVERRLAEAGARGAKDPWYDGRPVMVLANSPRAGVFNGDLGVVCRDGAGGAPGVCFAGEDGGVRRLPPGRIGAHETAFAITVHKSQGSEFDEVSIVLPPRPSPVLTRELLYTALTRARARAEIVGGAEIVAHAIENPTIRFSGLADRLRAGLGGR